MKDFPINDLLLAIDLNKISESIGNIFLHLRKIKSCKYQIERFLKLIEIISNDLLNQMLKVKIKNFFYFSARKKYFF
jgi:dynein heavy chain 1